MMSTFQKIVSKDAAEKFYMNVTLEFENPETQIDSLKFRALITRALHQLFGETGAGLPVDVLRFEDSTMEAVLRVPGRSIVKVWSALTLVGDYAQEPLAIRVNQVSPHLMALAVDSRRFFQDLPS